MGTIAARPFLTPMTPDPSIVVTPLTSGSWSPHCGGLNSTAQAHIELNPPLISGDVLVVELGQLVVEKKSPLELVVELGQINGKHTYLVNQNMVFRFSKN